jgi:hypothetical protein
VALATTVTEVGVGWARTVVVVVVVAVRACFAGDRPCLVAVVVAVPARFAADARWGCTRVFRVRATGAAGADVGRCATSAMITKPAASTDATHHGKRARSRDSSAIVSNTGKARVTDQGRDRLSELRARCAAVLGFGSSRMELANSRSASRR